MKFLCLISSVFSVGLLVSGEFNPRRVVPPFDAIVKPNIAAAKESKKWVKDNELVLGILINGEARAYPINMLTNPTREIINDHLGGRAIVATW